MRGMSPACLVIGVLMRRVSDNAGKCAELVLENRRRSEVYIVEDVVSQIVGIHQYGDIGIERCPRVYAEHLRDLVVSAGLGQCHGVGPCSLCLKQFRIPVEFLGPSSRLLRELFRYWPTVAFIPIRLFVEEFVGGRSENHLSLCRLRGIVEPFAILVKLIVRGSVARRGQLPQRSVRRIEAIEFIDSCPVGGEKKHKLFFSGLPRAFTGLTFPALQVLYLHRLRFQHLLPKELADRDFVTKLIRTAECSREIVAVVGSDVESIYPEPVPRYSRNINFVSAPRRLDELQRIRRIERHFTFSALQIYERQA